MLPVSTQSQSTIRPYSPEGKLLEQGVNLSEWRSKYPKESLLTKALFLGTSEHVLTILKCDTSSINTVYTSAYYTISLINRLVQRIAEHPNNQGYQVAFKRFATDKKMDKQLLNGAFKLAKKLLNEDLFRKLEKDVFLREDHLLFPIDT